MVYVDDAAIAWKGKRWYHLMADSQEELHAFAKSLGLRREWAQIDGHTYPHYDVTEPRRIRAIRLGAVQMSTINMVKMFRERKERCQASS